MESLPKTAAEYRIWYEANIPEGVEWGECWCSCGERTTVPDRMHAEHLRFIGLPVRFRRGHDKRRYGAEYDVLDLGYETPCWVSRRTKDEKGYARQRDGQKMTFAHRVSYEREHGPIPEGMPLDHLCVSRTRGAGGSVACMRPSHLEVVTSAENARRKRNGQLTAADARAIRAMHQTGRFTQREIARLFFTSAPNVNLVVKGNNWRGV